MIQVKETMQDKDLKNSKSKDKGSRLRSQSMNERSHYKQEKTKIRSKKAKLKRHIFNIEKDKAAVVGPPSLGRHRCFWAAVVRPSSLGHRAVSHTTDLEEDQRWLGFVVRYTWVEEVGKDDIHSNQSNNWDSVGTLTSDQLHYFNSQGYLVIESFSSNEEVDALRKRMDELLHGFNPSSSPSVFSTKNQVTSGQIARTGMVALSYVQIVSEKVSLATDLMYNYMSRDATASFGYDYMLCQCRLKRKIDSNGCTYALLEERLNMGLNFILSAEGATGQTSKAGNDGIASPSSCNCSVITIDTLAGLFSDIYDIACPLLFLNSLNATLHLVDILDSTEEGSQSDSESSETSANGSFSNRHK
ncbi:mitochondrial import receptor subunit TOM40-1-like protein [Tanacetum coccineum]